MKTISHIAYTIIIIVGSIPPSLAQETDLQAKVDELEKKLAALEARLEVVDQRFVNLEAVDETGEIDPTARNAEFLDHLDSAQFLRSDGKAVDAYKLDGVDSSGYLRANGKAVDADKLDGFDSKSLLINSTPGSGIFTDTGNQGYAFYLSYHKALT